MNKVKWVLGISMIFILIIITNLIDRSNFNQIRDSVVAIYDDRLVSKDMIVEMTRLFHEKELAIATSNMDFFEKENKRVNENLDELLFRFGKTKLTYDEEKVFNEFKTDVETMKQSEELVSAEDSTHLESLSAQLEKVKEDLLTLSEIQLKEGRRQVSISKRAINSIELFTHIEIYFLIFLAIVAQIVILYKPKS